MKSEKDIIYKLTRNANPPSVTIPSRNTKRSPLLWYDDSKKQQRALRYSPNQRSPFEDEQDENVIIEPIVFINGFLRVPYTNPVLQKFLELHPMNGKKFSIVDDEVDAGKEVDRMTMEIDALTIARNLPIEETERIARVILGKNVSSLTSSELKRDVLLYAKRYPEKFIAASKDPSTKLQSTIRELFDVHLLAFRNNKKDVFFNMASKKSRMLTVPFEADPYSTIEQYFLTETGLEELKALQKELELIK